MSPKKGSAGCIRPKEQSYSVYVITVKNLDKKSCKTFKKVTKIMISNNNIVEKVKKS
jgi:hypothetical protein